MVSRRPHAHACLVHTTATTNCQYSLRSAVITLLCAPWAVRFNVIQEIRINDTLSFSPNSPDLREESEPILDAVGFVLNNRPEIKKVVVEGHTCDCPSWGYSNQELSEARAQAVQAYLLTNAGVDESRLRSVGFGEERPFKPNTTRENKASNRRSEFLVY